MTQPVSVEGRLIDESLQMQEVARELADAVNVLAGWVYRGTGAPENVVAAPVGALYLREDGTAGSVFYVKEADSGLATGWVAK